MDDLAVDPDWIGYLASAAVFLTFCMQTMLLLRIVAVVSNIAFIGYALAADLAPILVLHGALLPLNLARLAQMQTLPRRAERALAEKSEDFLWLAELGESRQLAPGEVLFEKGDLADSMYVVERGEVEIPEYGATLGPGALIGEVGLFAEDNRRTATARAPGLAAVSRLTRDRVRRLHYDNPRFAYSLTRLITARLLTNMRTARRE
jgi:hypothetical protein